MVVTMNEFRQNVVKYVVLSKDHEIVITDQDQKVAVISKQGQNDSNGEYTLFNKVS